jgi:hypothetical protein
MQLLHDVWQNFVIFFSLFWKETKTASLFCPTPSYFASAELIYGAEPCSGNPLADVPFSC